MAIDRQQIEPAVEIVVEEKNAERERLAAGRADALRDGLVGESQRVVLRNVKGGHFVSEVADGNAERIVFLNPRGIDPHRAARAAIVVEGEAGERADFLEGAGSLVVE